METIFQRLLDSNFSDLVGLTAGASIPVPQDLINEILAVGLHGNKTIDSCLVFIHRQNRIALDLKTFLWPWPLNVKMKLDKSVDFASYSSPKIRAWLESNRLFGSLGSLFNVLPEGVKLYGDQVVIDIEIFLAASEQKRYLDLVKSVEIRTEEGKVIFDVKVEVN